jgi:hypothetical protein
VKAHSKFPSFMDFSYRGALWRQFDDKQRLMMRHGSRNGRGASPLPGAAARRIELLSLHG